MTIQERLAENWTELAGKVRERWGQLTEEELADVEGSVDRLVNLIQQKTGEARQQIEQLLGEFSEHKRGKSPQGQLVEREEVLIRDEMIGFEDWRPARIGPLRPRRSRADFLADRSTFSDFIESRQAQVVHRAEPAKRPLLAEQATRPNVVVVKLKASPAVSRRFATMASVAEPETQDTMLGRLITNRYVLSARPVFDGMAGLESGAVAARQPWAATLRNVALAAQPRPNKVRRAHGLCVLEIAPDANPHDVTEQLKLAEHEIEYAYVPAVKYPTAKKKASSGKKGSGPSKPKPKSSAKKNPPGRRSRVSSPNDPLFSRQWNHAAIQLHQARLRSNFDPASEVIIAVLDSGIDEGHPDLQPSIHSYTNYLHATEDDKDYVGHGSHVSGIIAAVINNDIGIAGICNARIMAIKGLPRAGNPWDAQQYYKALAHPMDHGARILNLSLGGGFDPGEKDIIADLLDAGIIVIAAMGNEFEEGNPISFPAAYDGVIAVGATDEADRRASFSCTGSHIDLSAPGVNILSTVPRYPSQFANTLDYDSWPGTSMATPHVAAAAALLLAKDDSFTSGDVSEKLTATADHVPGQTDWNQEIGAGRLNVYRALA
jgi:uncharacterized protein YjbJ (UPF0337 family)